MLNASFKLCRSHFTHHKLQVGLTVLGIALAVATTISMDLLHQSTYLAYRDVIERLAGSAALQIANGDAGVPEELLDEVRHTPGVRAAEPVIQGFLPIQDHPEERLFVLGVNLTSAHSLPQ